MSPDAKRAKLDDMGEFEFPGIDLQDSIEREYLGSPAAKEEKRAISEVAVVKGLPVGLTKHIGKFLGKSSKGGRKTRRRRRKTSKKAASK